MKTNPKEIHIDILNSEENASIGMHAKHVPQKMAAKRQGKSARKPRNNR
jgi:hypothetical protein